MKLPIRQILRGKAGGKGVCCGDCCFKKPSSGTGTCQRAVHSVWERMEEAAPACAPSRTASYLLLIPTLPAPPRPAAGYWIDARAPLRTGRGRGRVPRARSDGRTSQWCAADTRAPPNQSGPLGPRSLKRWPFREITSASPGAPLSPFSPFTPGAAREGAAPRKSWGTGASGPRSRRLVVRTVHSWGVAQVPGRPCLKHVSGGCPGCHLPGLGLQNKGRSQSCVVDVS